MRCEVELIAKTPLLMHKDSIEWADHLQEWRQHPDNRNVSKAGDDRSPAFSWIGSLYQDDEHIVMPAELIMSNLKAGGSRVILKKTTTAKEITQSGLYLECGLNAEFFVNGKNIPVLPIKKLIEVREFGTHVAAVKEMGFCLDMRRAKVQSSKHVRIRPRFDNWSVKFTAEIIDPNLKKEIFEEVLIQCGKRGLCDWRPGSPKSPGLYGQFTAKVKWLGIK